MKFVVRADPGKAGEGILVIDKVTRFAAVETALGLIEQGMTGVVIEGDDGRVHGRSEFGAFVKDDF